MDKIDISDIVAADPQTLYAAWLDSAEHAAMTASSATVSADLGGTFSVWEGYASGKNVELQAPNRIVQTWRTRDFAADAPDSLLTITFEPLHDGSTKVRLVQENLPQGTAESYAKGWFDYYFTPMQRYFRKKTAAAHYGAAPKAGQGAAATSNAKPAAKRSTQATKKPATKPAATKAPAKKAAVKAKSTGKEKAAPKKAVKATAKPKATPKKSAPKKAATKKKSAKAKPAKKKTAAKKLAKKSAAKRKK